LRRKVKIRVRQPLSKIIIPIMEEKTTQQLDAVKDIILSEINVKTMEYITDTTGILVKKIKPNFKTLGPKYGKMMKQISAAINQMNQDDIMNFEKAETFVLTLGEEKINLGLEDVEIISEDIPGWLVANDGKLTVAMDVNITDDLHHEGIAREFINRIQNLRKESDFDVTDKIKLQIKKHLAINSAVEKHKAYIGSQTLAESVELVDELSEIDAKSVEIDSEIETLIRVEKISK